MKPEEVRAAAIDRFLRVEIEGDTPLHILVSTPFFAEAAKPEA